MDRDRRTAWDAAFAKVDEGSKVWELPPGEHGALLCPGLFEGLSDAEANEEAANVVRYWLHGRNLSPIKTRGSVEADNWFAMRADAKRLAEEPREDLQTEKNWRELQAEKKRKELQTAKKLRNMIEASAIDPDYWEALKLIAARLHATAQMFPDDLADWASAFFKDELTPPPKHKGDKGRPSYAQDNRNYAIADVFGLLGYLGLDRKMVRYGVLQEHFGVDERTVMNAINSASKLDGKLPRPEECWPPPPNR